MSHLDPDRFALRQADQAWEAYAQSYGGTRTRQRGVARLPTRRDQALMPLRIVLVTAITTAALVILWFETFSRHCA
jgi:hypothetical protein